MALRYAVVSMLFVACSLTNSLDDLSGNGHKDGGVGPGSGATGGADASVGGSGGTGGSSGGGGSSATGASGGAGGLGAGGGAGGTAGASGSGATGASGGTGGTSATGGVGGSGGSGATGASGGVTGGGGSGGTGGNPVSCPNGHLPITDDFSDGAVGSIWSPSADTGLTILEGGGLLKFIFASTVAANAWAALDSNQSFDLTGCSVILHVVAAPTASDTFLAFGVLKDNSNYIEFDVNTGELSAAGQLAGSYVGFKSVPFSPTQHGWWKISEQGGTVSWALSPDGKNWAPYYSQNAPFSVTALTVFVGSGADKTTTSATEAWVDNLDLPPP